MQSPSSKRRKFNSTKAEHVSHQANVINSSSTVPEITNFRQTPEAMIPDGDREAMCEILQHARPMVLRGFARAWPLVGRTLAEVLGQDETTMTEKSQPVEVQVGNSGSSVFHGYGGILERLPLSGLPALGTSSQEPLYLVQCPIWSSQEPAACPAKHVLNRMPFCRRLIFGCDDDLLSRRLESVNLWVSIGTTHSNLHYDSKHGLLVVLQGEKLVEVFSPEETPHLAAFPVSDPLRAHHSAVPHSCLATRFGLSCASSCHVARATMDTVVDAECRAHSCPYPDIHSACGWQARLKAGDALFIPEGWWHHVLTEGSADASVIGHTVGIAVNLWWCGYPREPACARPYVLRRILSDLLALRTADHQINENLSEFKGDAIAFLRSAACKSQPPRHNVWRQALAAVNSTLPEKLAAAALESRTTSEALHSLLDDLDDGQTAALLTTLDAAAAEECGGGDAAASLRKLWRTYPQERLVARWASHLHTTLETMIKDLCSSARGISFDLEDSVSVCLSKGNDSDSLREASSRRSKP